MKVHQHHQLTALPQLWLLLILLLSLLLLLLAPCL
jgi:hypothetical protein